MKKKLTSVFLAGLLFFGFGVASASASGANYRLIKLEDLSEIVMLPQEQNLLHSYTNTNFLEFFRAMIKEDVLKAKFNISHDDVGNPYISGWDVNKILKEGLLWTCEVCNNNMENPIVWPYFVGGNPCRFSWYAAILKNRNEFFEELEQKFGPVIVQFEPELAGQGEEGAVYILCSIREKENGQDLHFVLELLSEDVCGNFKCFNTVIYEYPVVGNFVTSIN